MPIDPTTDPDFMAAAPSDQLKYLSHIDADFAAANPVDQLSYLSHLRGDGPVAGVPKPPAMSGILENNPTAGLPGGSTGAPVIASDTAIKVGAGAIGAAGLGVYGSAMLPALKAAGKALPYVAASEGINYARQNLPGGKYIPPGAEFLPFFMGGGEAKPQGKPIYPGAPLPANPGTFPGAPLPAKPPNEVLQSRGLYEGTQGGQPIPGAALDKIKAQPVYPGAPFPETPPPELLQAGPLGKNVPASLPAAQTGEALGQRAATFRPEGAPGDVAVPIGKVPQAGPRPNGPYSGPNTPTTMEPAQSGNIAKYGYIPETRTMVTEFNNGKVYQHTGVPKEIYDNFRNAESQGSYFAQNIKGRYTTRYRGSVSPTSSK